MHLQSVELTRIIDAAQRAAGGSPKDAPPVYAPTAADAVEALDSAGVRHGLALSGAYFWGSPHLRSPLLTSILDSLGISIGDERARVRAENVYLAGQVADYSDRLVGACSVNPLKDYAVEEVEICGADPGIGAMKLHFANSMVDFSDAAHLARLRTFFRAMEKTDLVAVVHLRNRGAGYGAEDAAVFIREVLTAAPDVPVQIVEQNALLAERMRQVGINRVVVETDWPFFPPVGEPHTRIARYRERLRSVLPLEPAEFDRFFSSLGPMFRGVSGGSTRTGERRL